MHLVVFDIDGTLVDSEGFDGELYVQSIRDVLGIHVDSNWSRYSNVTDSGILDEILDEHGISGSRDQIHRHVKNDFVGRTRHFTDHPKVLREIPGAVTLVQMLRSHPLISVAIATGGWRETAALKLRGVGLDPETIPIATASDSMDRCAIIRIAAERIPNPHLVTSRTYVGDGSWDKLAAARLNYAFIGVGNRVIHHRSVLDFTDQGLILSYLGIPRRSVEKLAILDSEVSAGSGVMRHLSPGRSIQPVSANI